MSRRAFHGRSIAWLLAALVLGLGVVASAQPRGSTPAAPTPAAPTPTAPAAPTPAAATPAAPSPAAPAPAAATRAAPTPAAKKEAKERFDRGIVLFNEGDNAGALSEFKRAYELIPNQLVLFNIGLTYAGMKRPVEAVDTLDAVLADPKGLNASQLELATRTREDQQRRIGFVLVSTNVPATITVDGVEVLQTRLDQSLRIAQGTHVIAAAAPDRIPRTREITVAGGEQLPVELDLVLTNTASAQLLVSSPLREVEISVDGKAVGKTPFAASITVEPGRHSVSASRPGYVSETRELQVAQGGTGKLDFGLREDAGAPANTRGELQLQLSEPVVDVSVDQIPRGHYLQPLLLPIGPHVVRVERTGFEPTERSVEVVAGKRTSLPLQLTATSQTRAAYRDSVTTQRTWGWVGVLGGAALIAGGVTLAAVEQGQLNTAHGEYDAVSALFEKRSGKECDMLSLGQPAVLSNHCAERLQAAQDRVDSRAMLRNVGFIGAGVGAAAAITGLVLLLTAGDPNKYESSAGADRAPMLQIVALPGGASLVGRF